MIKVEKVSRNYKTGESVVRALRQVSLEIQDGEFLSIAGPSGSGKTTLLNLIGCIDAIDDGEISINGQIFLLRKEAPGRHMLPTCRRCVTHIARSGFFAHSAT